MSTPTFGIWLNGTRGNKYLPYQWEYIRINVRAQESIQSFVASSRDGCREIHLVNHYNIDN